MNKKLLSLVIAGVLAVTSVPFVSASAAESKTIDVASSMRGRIRYKGEARVTPGCDAYDRIPGKRVTYIPAGDVVDVYDDGTTNYYLIEYQGERYYIRKSCIYEWL